MIRKGFLLFSTLILLMAMAACGGNGAPGASPTGPSAPPATAPATSGATIDGVVSGLAGTSAAGLVGARDVVTVTATVGDVTVTATVDGQGRFVIKGLPAGTVTLTFTGTNATVTLENVSSTEKIKIMVTIAGGTATVETQERALDGKIELEGRISAFEPAEVTRTGFYIGETFVLVPATAQMLHGSTPVALADLSVGDRVHVRAPAPATTGTPVTLTAEVVIVQNTNPKVPVNLKGKVGAFTLGTSCPDLEFALEGWTVFTVNGVTDYKKGTSCANIVAGAGVHVKGDVDRATGKVKATSIQFDK